MAHQIPILSIIFELSLKYKLLSLAKNLQIISNAKIKTKTLFIESNILL